jgi:hypothetical protein
MANSIGFGGGGSPSSGRFFTGTSEIFTPSMFTYPTGNLNLDGARPVVNAGVSLNGSFSGGITGQGADTSGKVFVTSNGTRTNVTGYIGNGFSMFSSPNVGTFNGGFQGTFFWYTVATAPGSISLSKTGRNITVTATGSGSNGGEPISSYQVQYRTSSDNVTFGSWGNTQTLSSLSYTYSSLTPALWYQFRVFANNPAGASAGTVSSSTFVSAGGRRWNGSAWNPNDTAKRWNGSAWVDLSIARRWNGSAWIDLT